MGLGWTGELRLHHFNQLQLTVVIGTLLSGLPGLLGVSREVERLTFYLPSSIF